MELTKIEKDIIKNHFLYDVIKLENNFNRAAMVYFLLSSFITVGSVLITSFLILEKVNILDETTSNAFFWTAWVLSVLVMIANKSMYGLNIHRKYLFNKEILKRYHSEWWQFTSGINKYRKCKDIHISFRLFCTRISRIEQRNIELIQSSGKSQDAEGVRRDSDFGMRSPQYAALDAMNSRYHLDNDSDVINGTPVDPYSGLSQYRMPPKGKSGSRSPPQISPMLHENAVIDSDEAVINDSNTIVIERDADAEGVIHRRDSVVKLRLPSNSNDSEDVVVVNDSFCIDVSDNKEGVLEITGKHF